MLTCGCTPAVGSATGFRCFLSLSFALHRAVVGLVPVGSLLPSGSQPSRWGHPCGVEAVSL